MSHSRAIRLILCAGVVAAIALPVRAQPDFMRAAPLRDAAQQQSLENFTFQGRLDRDTRAFTGAAAIRIRVYDSEFGGSILTGIEYPPLAIIEGLVNLDVPYDPAIFDGSPRWLEVAIRDQFGTVWEVLGDRMSIKAAPSSQVAQQARGLVLPATVASSEEGMGLLAVDNTSTTGFALLGTNNFNGTAGALGFPDAGVLGETETAGVQGVRGQHFGPADDTAGVQGTHVADSFGIGVEGKGGYAGVQGIVEFTTAGDGTGVVGGVYGYGAGVYSGVTGIGQTLNGDGISIGVQGSAASTGGNSFGVGVYGIQGASPNDWAGYFDGDVFIGGQTYSGQGGLQGAMSAPIAVSPLAVVSIDRAGALQSCAGCVESVARLGAGVYEVSLAGGVDSSSDITVSATPVGAFAVPVVTPMEGGRMVITLHAPDGSPVEAGLQLTVHDARPGKPVRAINAPGVRTLPAPGPGPGPGSRQLPSIDGDDQLPAFVPNR